MATEELSAVLRRFDTWLASQGEGAQAMLRPPASKAALERASKAIKAPIPPSLQALWAWHDGETPDGDLFKRALAEALSVMWTQYSATDDIDVRFMTLAEVSAAFALPVQVEEAETNACTREEDRKGPGDYLVPFAWVRGQADDDDDEPRLVADDDWLLAVDTRREAVWLFEPANEGLEGEFEEAPSLSAWLATVLETLEKGEPAKSSAKHDEEDDDVDARNPASIAPPAELMVKFLLDRNLVELADGATIGDIAARLAPILERKPEKRAIADAAKFFEDDDGIEELFADDEVLHALAREFVG